MKNQKGITLVELLAVLAITGIIIVLIFSVLLTGSNASHRTAAKQQMQQEANYIVEVVRNEYLKLHGPKINLKIEGVGEQQKLKMGSQVISRGYNYKIIEPASGTIDPTINSNLQLELSAPNSKPFIIKTTLSKLR
ncbi:type II secretion system protein [Planococcus liqunii]|uniref:PilW family protein n=1 Tax=Planococcus liqunii TaxID=3058394 RepID=UPI00261AA775|nr:type II secretion system protein [Planococcus sp. N056]WKA52392.1 type II secretion system protein [Planococcus sp. N056]